MNIEKEFNGLILEIEKASLLAKRYFDADGSQVEVKGDSSPVTEVDKGIEKMLRKYIEEKFPDDAIVGEEDENKDGTSSFVWHIDPIDGTDNFVRKIPFCGVSVARLGDGPEDSFGIVHNPLTGHTFSSLMENGAYENGRVTNLNAEPLGGRYVIAMGPGKTEPWMRQTAYRLREKLAMKFGKSSSYGSTALELAYLSSGRIDGFLTFGLKTYDYAAGLFLVKAAGGKISVFEDDVWAEWTGSVKALCDRHNKTIFASHPDVHDEMTNFIGDPKSHMPS